MSTRSGKRIHSTAFDNTDCEASDAITKLGKKTRNRRFKENDEHQEVTVGKSKKQKHYVGYPTDDEGGYVTATDVVDCAKPSRKSKKNALKEQDINVPDNEDVETCNEDKVSRVTRQTRKFADNVDDGGNTEALNGETSIPNGNVKGKKINRTKRRSHNYDINENEQKPAGNVEVVKVSKKSKRKKKGKNQNTSSGHDKQTMNKSNISTDSFHSAAGSPLTLAENMDVNDDKIDKDRTLVKEDEPETKNLSKKDMKKKMNLKKSVIETTTENITENEVERTRKSSLKNKNETSIVEEVIIENNKGKKRKAGSETKDLKELTPVVSNNLDSTYDKIDIDEETKSSDKAPKARRSLRLNDSTTENLADIAMKNSTDKHNTTFENDTKYRRSIRSNNSTTDIGKDITSALNTTYEKNLDKSPSKIISLDSTFDKSPTKINTTFDKIDSDKSSLISSDGAVNATFDKDNSKISITSDESNIINTTPVLIESSLDESRSSASKRSKYLEVPKDDTLKVTPLTPLKREGTFTKDCPEVVENKTPTKRQTLPSPGFTPFHVTRSSNKEKSLLNVTRSLEKPGRRSSLADLAPTRQTRVMFCSPMNNPAVVSQQKRKVIKSSMKGSNKSFVFEDNAVAGRAAGGRKRSFAPDGAPPASAKRKRLAEDLQLSVDRLSRPRTSSASAKLPETTPSKKQPTPSKPRSEPKRTKLPNFAALHQKQFDKMESLSDCQQRKMRRAKKLMMPKTPNGTVVVLERSSPRGTTESPKQKEVAAKKTETPSKTNSPKNAESKVTKLPTLESLRPGFTRFGFKMHTDFNPFSIPSKSDTKLKKTDKQNGVAVKPVSAPKTPATTATRQPTLPSLNGCATTTRKQAAKQTVMREKSFTSLGKRDAKRNESRTIIKGVRTNRRFELQMKMRNID